MCYESSAFVKICRRFVTPPSISRRITALFGDPEPTPLKGQLEVLLPQPEIDYALGMGDLYMFPRADGILLGGTREPVETLEPNPDASRRILEGHRRIFARMETSG